MCGIFGALSHHSAELIDRYNNLKCCTDTLTHRGPDGAGYECAGNAFLGHRRLSIIDLAHGAQPLTVDNRRWWITYNGEVYNYRELREELEGLGFHFETTSDTEVILQAYRQWGENCLEKFRGMFAFGIWDAKKRTLFLARDRLGVKPLYYAMQRGVFLFGSELKALIAFKGLNLSLNRQALSEYTAFQYIPSPRTIYNECMKLPPAHSLLVQFEDEGKFELSLKRYWDFDIKPNYEATEEEWKAELNCVLSESVRYRMVADVPVGAFLSGGIDSSAVAAYMAKNSTEPIHAFTIAFNCNDFNELPAARRMADFNGNIEIHSEEVTPRSIELLDELTDAFDEPFGDSSAIPTWYLCRLAARSLKVVQSGDGGDESFLGYDVYRSFEAYRRLFAFPAPIRRMVALLGKTVVGDGKRGDAFFSSIGLDSAHWHAEWMSVFRTPLREKLFSAAFREEQGELYPEFFSHFNKQMCFNDPLAAMQYTDTLTYLPEDIMTKVDRMSMRHSLEAREPLLDHKLIELAARIPTNLKLKNGAGKYILKEAVRPLLPPTHFSLPKKGFGVPLTKWFQKDLRSFVEQRFTSPALFELNYINQDFVRKIVDAQLNGRGNFHNQLWSLLMLEQWLCRQDSALFR